MVPAAFRPQAPSKPPVSGSAATARRPRPTYHGPMGPTGRPQASPRSEAERGRAYLSLGILAFRWAALAWMVVIAVNAELARPAVAAAAIGAVAAWTLFLSAGRRGRAGRRLLLADLALCAGLNVVAGLVVRRGQTVGAGGFALLSTVAYPIAAAAWWGANFGMRAGLAAGGVLGASLVAGELVNHVPLGGRGVPGLLQLLAACVNFAAAGTVVGLVAELFERSAAQLRGATEAAMAARERAARLAEREALAREIHDSVLQVLALVHKRGQELAAAGPAAPAEEVARLAAMAGDQEQALRELILREPAAGPGGSSSLRAELERLARRGAWPVPLSVSATGPIWLPSGTAGELVAAVRQALDNVGRHAGAARASVFADQDAGAVMVTVRDDGAGFDYDEARLARDGKIGMLKSMKGRVEQLGGSMRVSTGPGAGTEVEFRVPLPGRAAQDGPGGAGGDRGAGV